MSRRDRQREFRTRLHSCGASSRNSFSAGRIDRLFYKPQITAIGNLSRWAFLLTFAGVGLRTNLRELGKQGARPFLVGALGEIAIAALTLGLLYGAARIFQL
jgi:uncharacterized membrane protein YadS